MYAFKCITATTLIGLLVGCNGGSDSSANNSQPTPEPIPEPTPPIFSVVEGGAAPVVWPSWVSGQQSAFRDIDTRKGYAEGTIWIKSSVENASNVVLRWADSKGEPVGSPLYESDLTESAQSIGVSVANVAISQAASGFSISTLNEDGEVLDTSAAMFLDYYGNAEATGPGGNPETPWQYGVDRDTLKVYEHTNGRCYFDNGHAYIIDMNNESDERESITLNDVLYPAYSFDCLLSYDNIGRIVWYYEDEGSVSTYSALNDTLHYATLVHDFYFKYLATSPLPYAGRARVHYGSLNALMPNAHWDGAYTNYTDSRYLGYGMTSMDVVMHEFTHGVLASRTALSDPVELPMDARTLHEAFSDISAMALKHSIYGDEIDNFWTYHYEVRTPWVRNLDQIAVTSDAYVTALDREETDVNPYLSIGMVTYPFYRLSQTWGIEDAYKVFLHAAMSCWGPDTDLIAAGQCVKEAAAPLDLPDADVINAFKDVKIPLFEQGTLAHFDSQPIKRLYQFSDLSQTFGGVDITQWHWDFGDGNSSAEASPEYEFAQGGDHQVTLTVTDSLGQSDKLLRTIKVWEDYCEPGVQGDLGIKLTDVNIAGLSIDRSQLDKWDYSDTLISINNDFDVELKGTVLEPHKLNFSVWADLNDDGLWQPEEKLQEQDLAEGEEISINWQGVSIDNSHQLNELRLRIAMYSTSWDSPCFARKEGVVDVTLFVN